MRAALPLILLLLLPGRAGAQDAFGPRSVREPAALAAGIEDPGTLARMADAALGARRYGEAAELLERAESRLLTRSIPAPLADRPAIGGAIGELAAARDAIGRRDPAGASRLIASALQRLEVGGPPAIAALPPLTGSGSAAEPSWGGGAAEALPGPLPGIAPQNMPVGGSTSPPVPFGPDADPNAETMKAPAPPGWIPPSSSKPPPL